MADGFLHSWRLWQSGEPTAAASNGNIERVDRRNLTRKLARLFDKVLEEHEAGR